MSNNLRLKYQRFKPSGSKDIGIKKFEFVAKIQFPCGNDSISFGYLNILKN